MDGKDIETMKQIVSESSLRSKLMEILVGRGNDPDVRAECPQTPEPLELPTLENAKKLHLNRRRRISNLVEAQRASLCSLEPSDPSRGRSSKGAPFVAEELAFEQTLRESAAVHSDERALRSAALSVDLASNKLLADPTLTRDEHRDIALRHPFDAISKLGRHRMRTYETDLPRLWNGCEVLINASSKLLGRDGHLDEVDGTDSHCLNGGRHIPMRREQHDGRMSPPDTARQAEPIEVGHPDVADDQIDWTSMK
jgi:hypothetical protein